MTIEEAIEQLSYVDGCQLVNDEYLYKGISVAMEVLEKQIPKNPIYSPPLGSREDWYCPVCESVIAYNSYVSPERGKSCRNYCDNCGQKIDWSKSIPRHKRMA